MPMKKIKNSELIKTIKSFQEDDLFNEVDLYKIITDYTLSQNQTKFVFLYFINDNYILKLLTKHQKLPPSIIFKYYHKLDLNDLTTYQKLPLKFLYMHADKLDFNLVSRYQYLTVNFIKKFYYKINWLALSMNTNIKLSNNLIKNFKHKLFFSMISKYRNLSPQFIIKYIDLLHANELVNNKYKPLNKLSSVQKLMLISKITDLEAKKIIINYFEKNSAKK